MTHGYEFFEYDYVDIDEDTYIAFRTSDIGNRDSKGRFMKGHIPWNKGMKINIYEGIE